MIKTLDAERKELLTDLLVAKSPLNDAKDSKVSSELAWLLNLTDRYEADVKSEKMQVCVSLKQHNLCVITQQMILSHSCSNTVTGVGVFQLSELNLQIKKVEKEVLELKKLDVSDSMLLQKSRRTGRNISSLENRLGVVSS
jgi:hypothetical protein